MKQIVVALEAGEDGTEVVQAAAELAEQTGAGVTVVAIDAVESQRFEAIPRSESLSAAAGTAERAAARLAERGINADARGVGGAGAAAVEEVAAEVGADLIVVGTGRRSALARRLLGDLALGLVESSQRQVLVITEGR